MERLSHALAVAARHGLQLNASDQDVDDMGLDFQVVHARDAGGQAWILRLPRRPEVAEGVGIEQRLLALVAPRLPAAVPEWRICTPELIAYPRLPGQPAVTVGEAGPLWHIIDPAAPSGLFIGSMARCYAALAGIDVGAAAATGLPVETIGERRAGLARKAEAARAVLEPPARLWDRWQAWLADDSYWPERVALVHHDLHPAHMLLDADGRLSGVLDWSDARVSDPSIDLAMFHGCFGRLATDEMLAAYAAAGGIVWPRLAEHVAAMWSFFPNIGAEWGQRVGNPAVIDMSRGHMLAWLEKNPV